MTDSSELPSVCGHKGTKIVQYSADDTGYLHTICGPCFSKGIYYVQGVQLEDPVLEIEVENWVQVEI